MRTHARNRYFSFSIRHRYATGSCQFILVSRSSRVSGKTEGKRESRIIPRRVSRKRRQRKILDIVHPRLELHPVTYSRKRYSVYVYQNQLFWKYLILMEKIKNHLVPNSGIEEERSNLKKKKTLSNIRLRYFLQNIKGKICLDIQKKRKKEKIRTIFRKCSKSTFPLTEIY